MRPALLTPILLRLLLGVFFLWAGLGKVLDTIPVRARDAAILADLGVIRAVAPGPPTPAADSPFGTPHAPRHTAAEFPHPIDVTRLHGVTLRLYRASRPALAEDGTFTARTWPEGLGLGRTPLILAWGVALTQLLAGIFLLIGLLTRFWALALCAITLGALWLGHLGPHIADGSARLGFLPPHQPFDPQLWHPLFLQLALFIAAAALLLSGPGPASIDRAIFRRPRDDDAED